MLLLLLAVCLRAFYHRVFLPGVRAGCSFSEQYLPLHCPPTRPNARTPHTAQVPLTLEFEPAAVGDVTAPEHAPAAPVGGGSGAGEGEMDYMNNRVRLLIWS